MNYYPAPQSSLASAAAQRHHQEPSAPPRRRRSLSTSRFDSFQQQQQQFFQQQPTFQEYPPYGLNQQQQQQLQFQNSFQNPRMRVGNYSSDHIPANFSPYGQQQQQQQQQQYPIISNQNPNIRGQLDPHQQQQLQQQFLSQQNPNYYNSQQFANNPNYNYNYPNSQQHFSSYNNSPLAAPIQPPSISAQSLLLAGMAAPLPRQLSLNLTPGHHTGSSTGYTSSGYTGSSGYSPSGRLSPTSPTAKSPSFRPHYDFLRSTNVQYNPYQTNVNPTLMAKPSLDGYQSSQISPPVATAIARGRDTMYSSREHLNQSSMGMDFDHLNHLRFGNQNKTPPARPPPPRLNRLSMENLSSAGTSLGYTSHDYAVPERRNRDRRSLSPTRVGVPGQRPYGGRSTSPLPNLSPTTTTSPMSYSTSVSRTNSINQRTPSHLGRTSRESSPMRTFLNFSKNLLSPKTSSSTTSTANTSTSSRTPTYDNSSHTTTTNNMTDYNNNNQHQQQHANDLLQVPTDTFQAKRVNELRFSQQPDQNFSQAFTDHCDQYKSLTSKILGKNYGSSSSSNTNRTSADYANEQQQQQHQHMNRDDLSSQDGRSSMNRSPATDMFASAIANEIIQESASGLRQQQQQQQQHMFTSNEFPQSPGGQTSSMLLDPNNQLGSKLSDKLQTIEQNRSKREQELRRNSSNSNLAGYQRKASLPAEYIASAKNNVDQLKLSNDWSRENVAHLAHEARERKLHPESQFKQRVKRMGVWFTRQFIFLLICALNALLAYMFYNLIYVLPD